MHAEAGSPQTAAAPGPEGSGAQDGGWLVEKGSAARAEAYVVAVALTLADCAITIITDNKCVWSKLQQLQKGQKVASAHQADLDQVRRRIHRLQVAHWVKAHLDTSAGSGGCERRLL